MTDGIAEQIRVAQVGVAQRCAWCHDDLGEATGQRCEACDVRLHADCWTLARGCPTLGCVERPPELARPRVRRVRRVRRAATAPGGITARRRFFRFMGAVGMPLLVFVLSAVGFTQPLLPSFGRWSGWRDVWHHGFDPLVHLWCVPLCVWSMVAYLAAERGARSPWIRVGLYGGVIVGLAFCVLFAPVMHIALVAIILLGLGLLGFTPLWTTVTYLAAVVRYRRGDAEEPPRSRRVRVLAWATWIAGAIVTAACVLDAAQARMALDSFVYSPF